MIGTTNGATGSAVPSSALAGPDQSWAQDWAARGACRSSDPDELFVQGAAQNRAKTVCLGCVVRTECLADALDNQVEFGVWGGMTERERRAVLKKRPNVKSWQRLLEAARTEHLTAGSYADAKVG